MSQSPDLYQHVGDFSSSNIVHSAGRLATLCETVLAAADQLAVVEAVGFGLPAGNSDGTGEEGCFSPSEQGDSICGTDQKSLPLQTGTHDPEHVGSVGHDADIIGKLDSDRRGSSFSFIVPAPDLSRQVTRIQSAWRGHRERSRIRQLKVLKEGEIAGSLMMPSNSAPLKHSTTKVLPDPDGNAMKEAFSMLNEKAVGGLHRSQARRWFNSLGWAVPDSTLDKMLDEQDGGGGVRASPHQAQREWMLPELMDIFSRHCDENNCTVGDAQSSLRTLARHRPTISHHCLVEFAVAELGFPEQELEEVLAYLGHDGEEHLGCDALGRELLEFVHNTPSVLELHQSGPRSGDQHPLHQQRARPKKLPGTF